MRVIERDITTVEEGIVAHQVNCQGAIGAGVSGAICRKWPEAERAYRAFCAHLRALRHGMRARRSRLVRRGARPGGAADHGLSAALARSTLRRGGCRVRRRVLHSWKRSSTAERRLERRATGSSPAASESFLGGPRKGSHFFLPEARLRVRSPHAHPLPGHPTQGRLRSPGVPMCQTDMTTREGVRDGRSGDDDGEAPHRRHLLLLGG